MPSKPEGPNSYRLISLLCVIFKILVRLIYVHIEPNIYPLLHKKQVKLFRGRSTVDEVTLLTPRIEDSFPNKKK